MFLIKVKNDKSKTDGVEIIFNINSSSQEKNVREKTSSLGKHIHPVVCRKFPIYYRKCYALQRRT